jgi:cytochrome P450
MIAAWRLLALLLAIATPMQLAVTVLGADLRRTVGGRLVQLGGAALLWCVVAAALFTVTTLGAAGAAMRTVTDVPLALMAMAGLGLLAYVQRARWRWWRQRTAPDIAASGGVSAPGSLSFARGIAALGDRHYYLRGFAEHGPVFRMSQFGAPTMCVLGLERRQAIMRQHGEALGPAPLPFSRSVLRGFLRYMDDATHDHYGPLMRRAMHGGTSASLHERLQHDIRERLLRASNGSAPPATATAFIEPLVREALDLLLFGFGADGDAGDSRQAATAFARQGTAFYHVQSSRRLNATEESMLRQLDDLLAQQEQRLHADGVADTVPLGRIRTLSGSAPDDTVRQNFVFLHRIATNNVSGLMAWLLVFWSRHPDIVARIRASSGDERQRLLERFLAETLRLSQSEYTYRTVARTFVHDGMVYPAGWLVRFCVWESHRDATVFDAPTEFRLRLGDQDYAKSRFAPFGTGRHACNGADLNETLCVALLSVLVDDFDVHAEPVEPLQRAPRHWGHWQPNARLSLRITRRAHP